MGKKKQLRKDVQKGVHNINREAKKYVQFQGGMNFAL